MGVAHWMRLPKPRSLITASVAPLRFLHAPRSYVLHPLSVNGNENILEWMLIIYNQSINQSVNHKCSSVDGVHRFLQYG